MLMAPAVLELAAPGGGTTTAACCDRDAAGDDDRRNGDSGDGDGDDGDRRVRSRLDRLLADAERRAARVEGRGRDLERFYLTRLDPLVRDLVALRSDEAWAKRLAVALVREGSYAGVDPRLLLAVVTVENPWLEPDALSPVGAVGLMQVMPFHAGGWGCESDDLTDPEANVCHGTRILADALRRFDGDLERALLRYNGCVHGANTPDCRLYPRRVLAHAGVASGTFGAGQLMALGAPVPPLP
jgi:soluble lytic murein transglycosylase-like protein